MYLLLAGPCASNHEWRLRPGCHHVLPLINKPLLAPTSALMNHNLLMKSLSMRRGFEASSQSVFGVRAWERLPWATAQISRSLWQLHALHLASGRPWVMKTSA